MKNYEDCYGCDFERRVPHCYGCGIQKRVPRERIILSIDTDLLTKIDRLAKLLNTSRPDIFEIILAFYFFYVKSVGEKRFSPGD